MSTTTLDAPSPLGLSRLRRNKDTQSTSSLHSSSSAGNESGEISNDTGGGLKASLSNAVDKVRKSVDGRRESIDSSVSPQRRLSNMFKRNKKQRGGDADGRRSSQQALDPSLASFSQNMKSNGSLLTTGSKRSSLLTDDGDESDLLARPGLSAHNSHQGFLTLSSPALNAREEPDTTNSTASDLAPPSPIKLALVPSIIEPTDEDTPQLEPDNERISLPPVEPPYDKTFSTTSLPQIVHETPSQQESEDDQEREGSRRPHSFSEPPAVNQDTEASGTSRTRLRLVPVDTDSAPETTVTPPTPTLASNARSVSPVKSLDGSVRRRRALSGGQRSKLSNATLAPLTPTVEEAKTPGGTLVQPTNASGFFASVFSVAQKAADQLTTNIGTTTPPKAKDQSRPSTAISHANKSQQASTSTASLALSTNDMASTTDLSQSQISAESEKEAAARAVSHAYEKPLLGLQRPNSRPGSVASNDRLTLNGDHTPQRLPEDGDALKRTGSVRSRFSARRHRGSSAATGSGIGAALRESAAGLSHVSTSGPGHRMTGFAVASKKRNKDFHQQFRSVPEDDYLVEDYSAALQRDILLHGRLYVSEGHICFSSNILGWVTNLVMSFDEIVSVEKKSTAVIFPNAIVIQTVSARNTFASFVARDSTYELIIGIWKMNHPHLKSSLNGVALENAGTGDKTEKADSTHSDESDTESDEFYDEDADDDGKASYTEGSVTRSIAGSDVGDAAPAVKPPTRSATAPPASDSKQTASETKAKEITENPAANNPSASGDALGPDTHAPTECGDGDQHYDRPLIDANIAAPLGKVYSLMWGPASGAFMSKWLVDDQKSRELDLKDDKTGLDKDHKTMTFSYIKPLGGSVGPKQTKCITTNTLEQFSLEKAVIVSCSTQTPDVPSGNVFLTKTRYCLTWGPNNSTRLVANCTIEWSGKSWLKGPIEKGAQDGQTQYAKDIVAALKAATASKSSSKPGVKKGKKRSKKDDDDEDAKEEHKPSVVVDTKPHWGPLEPLHPILEPVLDLVRPFLSPQVTIAVLSVLLFYTWLLPPGSGGAGVGFYRHSPPSSQFAIYEQLWQREEAELWDWLEDRVGLSEIHAAKLDDRKQRQKVAASKNMGKQIANEKMDQKQLDEAIQITEARLEALKDAVGKKKQKLSTTAVAP